MEGEVRPDYQDRNASTYHVSGRTIERVISFQPQISVEDAVKHMAKEIRAHGLADFDNSRYYNIRWMQMLEEARNVIRVTGDVFELTSTRSSDRLLSIADQRKRQLDAK